MKTLFRCEVTQHTNYSNSLYIREFSIVKETLKGHWIEYHGRRKFVLKKKCYKKFAHPTKEEALIDFIYRKSRHIYILNRNLDEIKHQKRVAEVRLERIRGGNADSDDI